MNFRWLFLAFTTLFAFGFTDNIRGPIYPELLIHFKITHSQGAWWFALVSLMSVVSSLLTPPLISRWGHIRVLRWSLVVMALGQLIFGFTQNFAVLLLGSFLFGIGVGGISVTQNVMVLLASETHHHQRLQSGLHSCYGASSLLAPLVVILLAWWGFGWQSAFLAGAGLLILLLLVSFLPLREGKILYPVNDKKMSLRSFWNVEEGYFALTLGLYVGLEVLVGSRMASYMREVQGMELQNSSLMVMIFFACLLAGRLLFVVWHPKIPLRDQLRTCMALTVLAVLASVLVYPPIIFISGFFLGPFYPIMMTAVGRLFPRRMEECLALCNASQGFTLVTLHSFVGVISDWGGMRAAMSIGIILSIVTFTLLTFYPRLFRRAFP